MALYRVLETILDLETGKEIDKGSTVELNVKRVEKASSKARARLERIEDKPVEAKSEAKNSKK